MNILYIHTHDTGRYIQPYGYAVPTPNLMALAREGTLFRQAFTPAPTCSPSRASLLTGMVPHSSGMLGLAHRGFRLTDYSRHLVQFLNSNRYETVLCGMHHEAPRTGMIGYETVLADFHNDEQIHDSVDNDLSNARRAADYLLSRTDDQRPFFLSFGMQATHREFPDIPLSIDSKYVHPPFPVPDTPESRLDMAAYIASAHVADQCSGIVLDALRESGYEKDTVVMFVTDHGLAFPNMKCTLYDTGIGVSLMLKYPGNPQRGEVIDSMVSLIDIFPTFCDLLSLEKPPWLQGTSLVPLLDGSTGSVRDEVFAEVNFHAAYQPMRAVRTERYKYIRTFGGPRPVPANMDGGISKDLFIRNGFLDQDVEEEMLFDLALDPMERSNLIGSRNYSGIHRDLAQRLQSWMRVTDDPLLQGSVPIPAGALVNQRECVSADEPLYEATGADTPVQ